ncbi:MAG TPA: DNA replication/repair protein RecF [Anaerolineales bacterium]|nr:DNA replication/repair protein RecF [Anaerolineales bacterium]
MRLNHLSLTDFRNYSRLDLRAPAGPILLVGGNAQGKTSLLEAVYYLATFVSFHASHDRELVNLLAARQSLAVGRIVADFQGQSGSHTLEVRLILESSGGAVPRLRKETLLDNVKRRAGEIVGVFKAVLFLPQMLSVVEGAPEERRRYLNLLLAQVYPWYAQALTEYRRYISQRNALLKQLAERGGDSNQLTYWDERLAKVGGQLIYTRIQAIRELEQIAVRIHEELTRNQELLLLDYQPSFDPLPAHPHEQMQLPLETPVDRSGITLEKIQQGYLNRLNRLRRSEIARGTTTVGPHRDELRFRGNGVDLGTYGSRGQARTVMLSMKLAEVQWIRQKTGEWPVLLLDEVLAELDNERRSDLLARLATSEQSLLTTTDLDLFEAPFVEQATVWNIRGGRLVNEPAPGAAAS